MWQLFHHILHSVARVENNSNSNINGVSLSLETDCDKTDAAIYMMGTKILFRESINL